jgi:2-methylcitrate dehydratase PrpD
VGKLLNLDEQKMLWALGVAAAQPVGLKEMFGTMTKSFHPGRAAQNGFTAALLASRGYTSSNQALEAKAGWANTLSPRCDYSQITEGLGETYEISLNTYKPYACGVVMHPAIDACIQLRNQHKLTPEQIAKIELRVNRLVPELTGHRAPRTGLEGKFSIYFAAAVAIVEGAAGERQFGDRLVRDAGLVALRGRVSITVDPAIHEDQVRAAITLKDGRLLETFVEHATGSAGNPMTDAALEAKFRDLADGVLPRAQAGRLMEACWNVESLASAAEIAKAAAA